MTPGTVRGLPQRLAEWLALANSPGTNWLGMGRHADLALMVRLLSLNEFGEWLRTHSDDTLQAWGLEVIEAAEAKDELEALEGEVEQNIPGPAGASYKGAVVIAGETISSVRAVLVECGALAPDDETTPISDLVRVLVQS